jgi:hypothetical protein
VAGRGRVDGAAAISLVPAQGVSVPYPWVWAVVWVDSPSYLPLQLIAVAPKSGPLKGVGSQIVGRWLPATAANLAKTRILPPPAGFRQVGSERQPRPSNGPPGRVNAG